MAGSARAGEAEGRRILVVEDDYFIAEGLRAELEDLDARVIRPVPAVAQALRIIASRRHPRTIVAEKVGALGDPVGQDLLEAHRHGGWLPFCLLRTASRGCGFRW